MVVLVGINTPVHIALLAPSPFDVKYTFEFFSALFPARAT